ncbi:MAG: GNAT family N-acetyltransferase [Polyangiales bacterium]
MPIRSIARADANAAAPFLARAFDADPIWIALFPDARVRVGALSSLFGAWIRLLHGGDGISTVDDRNVGAALWSAPGKWRIGLVDELRLAPAVLGPLGVRVIASLRLLYEVERVHPREPHYYLRLLGCDPAMQGKGLGAALVAPMMARLDAEKMPAYLESSNDKNLTFYRRHGFETMSTLQTSLGVNVTRMWREPVTRPA